MECSQLNLWAFTKVEPIWTSHCLLCLDGSAMNQIAMKLVT